MEIEAECEPDGRSKQRPGQQAERNRLGYICIYMYVYV